MSQPTDPVQPRGVAVVTGASSGIGAACTRSLAAAGFHAAAVAARADRLESLASELGDMVTPVPCDVTSDSDVAAMLDAVRAIGGPTTLLVNNAGGARGLDPIGRGHVEGWQGR